MALRWGGWWWRWRCGASARRAPPPLPPPHGSVPGPGSRSSPPALGGAMCHFAQRSSVLSFPKLCNIFWRFHHTSTSHMCSCSKTVSDEKYQDPFQLGRKDLKNLYEDIKKELLVSTAELREMCEYYFDGKGKAFRPMIVVLMARACNIHHSNSREVQASQRSVAIIAEMIHTASLVHDDVIDDANSRRGKMTVNQIWGERKAVLAGDFILSAASLALARIGNTTIISVLTQVIEDLVRGEFLQLGSKENENERFAHYLEKTFKKTASLIANSCKAVYVFDYLRRRMKSEGNSVLGSEDDREPLQVTLVQDLRNNKAEVEFPSVISQAGDSKISLAERQADWDEPACIPVSGHVGAIIHKSNFRNRFLKDLLGRRAPVMLQVYDVVVVSILGCPDPKVHEIAYQYGKNVGIAFQLIDDVLDFTSCADRLGKPAAADLKLGLATGPVLFACRQFPEMNAMIMRRFSKPGDVERARKYVLQSDGVQQTTYLAQRYCHEATREISKLRPSPEREALIQLTEMVLMRDK